MTGKHTGSDEHEQVARRREKLEVLRERGNPFPNDFRRDALAGELHDTYDGCDKAVLEESRPGVAVAGRMMTRRVMGKTSFIHLRDVSDRPIQLYVKRDVLGEQVYAEFKKWDLGDIVGARGTLFKTNSGELSVMVESLALLTKSLRPLPEKFHGLADRETRYRQRYLDLISNEDTRGTFRKRARIIEVMRRFLCDRGFLEVETPMMQVIPGGAVARPFMTHHNALDMDLYLRIAPELYLKRLVVGGFERVFEINRNFRNEGLSTLHNPEFTMLEFYQAYADYKDFMDLTEQMMRGLARALYDGGSVVSYQGRDYDLDKAFQRMSVEESIIAFNPDVDPGRLRDAAYVRSLAERLNVALAPELGTGKALIEIFEKTVEPHLFEPTFITAYPTEVSPLSRRRDGDPFVTDRFEFFVAGMELANGFSELNDAEDQAERFREQARSRGAGDDEAMYYDDDYVRALEHGLPPAAGEGVGVDRTVMFFTDQTSIRDVVLFPHMRPEKAGSGTAGEGNEKPG